MKRRENYGKRKKTESENTETDDGSYRADSSGRRIRSSDYDRNVNDEAGGCCREIAERNLSYELHLGSEIYNTDLDVFSYETSADCSKRFFSVNRAYDLSEIVDDERNCIFCNFHKEQCRNYESDRNDTDARSSKDAGEDNHSHTLHSFYEMYTAEPNVESSATNVEHVLIETSGSYSYSVSRELPSATGDYVASDLNLGNCETVTEEVIEAMEIDGSDEDSDISEEMHEAHDRDQNIGNRQLSENNELSEREDIFGRVREEFSLSSDESSSDDSSDGSHEIAGNEDEMEKIGSDDQIDIDEEEECSNETDEEYLSDDSECLSELSVSSESNDEGYTTAENAFFSDAGED